YVGNLADVRGLREMRAAAELVNEQLPLKLLIAGKLISGARAQFYGKNEYGLVEHLGPLGRPQLAELLARARGGLVILHPTGNYVDALPTKLFEYMSAILPVVVSDFPILREIVGSAGCGLLVNPLDPAAIAEALLWLLRHPAEAAAMGHKGHR